MAIEADSHPEGRAAPRTARAWRRKPVADRVVPPGPARAITIATVVLVVAGGLLRIVAVVAHQGVIYPDETYQMTEAAHRVVFGYGIVPWEFRDGLRSWIGPGFLIPPTALARPLGLDGLQTMIAVKVWVELWTTVGIAAAVLVARRLAGPLAGLLAATIVAFSPLSAVYDVHPLADTVAAPLPVLALLLLLDGWPSGAAHERAWRASVAAGLAGVLLVAALALRPQLAPVVVGFLVAVVLTRSRARTLGLPVGLATGAGLSALLDTLTWGVPFAPEWRSLTFNVLQNGGSEWGRQRVTFYLHWTLVVLGPVLVVLLGAGLVLAVLTDLTDRRARRAVGPGFAERFPLWPLIAGLAAMVAVLSALEHKELRFLVPALPLAGALAAVGLTRTAAMPAGRRETRRASMRRTQRMPATSILAGLAVFGAVAGVLRMPGITMRDLGYTTRDLDVGRLASSAWVGDDATPRLLSAAGRLSATCGVAVLAQRLTWTGGYSYLHRNVPLGSTVQNQQAGNWRAWANAIVTTSQQSLPLGFSAVARSGHEMLALRPGPCAPAPPVVRARFIPAAQPSPPGRG